MDNGIIINGKKYKAEKVHANSLSAFDKCDKCPFHKRNVGCLRNYPCGAFAGNNMVAYFVELKDEQE